MTNTTNTAAASVEMIDSAMVEMQNIHPPLKRSECQRLINAALAAPAQAATAKQSPQPEYNKGFSDGWNRCEARQAAATASQPVAVPAAGPVGFDHKTAANFLNGKTVADEEMRRFVACSRWAHDDRDGLRNTVSDLRREIAQRDAEIALLKISLLAAEQPAQQGGARQPLTDSQISGIYFEALGSQHLREQDRKTVTRFARAIEAATAPQPAAQAAPVDAAAQKDAARYRFLRDGDWRDTGLERYIVLQLGLMWDDKIDAAIAAQQGATDAS